MLLADRAIRSALSLLHFIYMKIRYDLIPVKPLKRLAARYVLGAEKYAPDDWKKCDRAYFIEKGLRHFYQWLDGERDEDHLAAAAFHIFALMYFDEQ